MNKYEYLYLNKVGQEKLGLKRIVLTNVSVRPHKHIVIWK